MLLSQEKSKLYAETEENQIPKTSRKELTTMASLEKNIIGLTLGIRFKRSFRIPDISGDLIDNILYSEKTPFGTNFFPNVQENSAREKTLFNPKTSEYLRINTDDFILGIEVNNEFDKKFNWLKKEVLKYYQEELFKTYEIKNIRRLGIIFSHKINRTKKLTQLVSSLTENKITSADGISFSFSRKEPSSQALFRKGVNDYKNTIYNFLELKEAVQADFDYQYYYEPVIEDLREGFTEKILDSAKTFLEDNFYKWLNKYESEKSR